jgi:hypothetical protein
MKRHAAKLTGARPGGYRFEQDLDLSTTRHGIDRWVDSRNRAGKNLIAQGVDTNLGTIPQLDVRQHQL